MLDDALEAAAGGSPQVVLVDAESGGGKSRLVTDFAARVRGRALVLAGGCVDLGAAGLPFAPFTAALRVLIRERGAGEVTALLPGGNAGELAALVPELGSPPSGGDPEMGVALLQGLAELGGCGLTGHDSGHLLLFGGSEEMPYEFADRGTAAA